MLTKSHPGHHEQAQHIEESNSRRHWTRHQYGHILQSLPPTREEVMASRLVKLLKDPKTYGAKIAAVALQQFCRPLRNASFFLQGQMDIHPRSRWRTPFIDQLVAETGGFYPRNARSGRFVRNLDPYDNTRRDMLALLLRTVLDNDIPGSFAEVGVYQGLTARLIHHYAPERRLHLFDTFEGFTERSAVTEMSRLAHPVPADQFADTSVDRVRRFMELRADTVVFHRGFFPESVPASLDEEWFALVHLDADLYQSILDGLTFFYPRASPHGLILVHDYNSWLGARRAVDEFMRGRPEAVIPMPDKSGSALIVKA
jgi:O-methyltransferase